MIKFSLKCAEGHSFESWFQSGSAFDTLNARGMVTCPHCGSGKIEKALMAPAITGASTAPAIPESTPEPPDISQKIKDLRAYIEAHSNDVGDQFVTEARAMYLGDIPDRPIHGVAAPDEAKALLDDGVPVLPLPFAPARNTN